MSLEQPKKRRDKIKSEFATTSNDSNYVMINSELQFYTSNAYSTAVPESHGSAQQHLNYPNSLTAEFENAEVGDIVGPYEHLGKTNIAKVIGFTKF